MSDEYAVCCPMPGCEEALYAHFEQDQGLTPEDLATVLEDDENPMPSPSDAHTAGWSVLCSAGHVLLLPGDTGCPCEPVEQGGDACPHYDDDYDWSEESRVFREHDMARLRDVIARLAATP